MSGTPRDRLVDVARALSASAGASGDDALLADLALLGDAQRALDAIAIDLAGRVADRCPPEGGSLAHSLGARSASDLMALRSGLDGNDCAAWVAVGSAVAPRLSLLGEILPSAHAPLADAVARAAVDVGTARQIVRTIGDCRLDPDESAALETTLLAHADELGRRDFARLCRDVVARLSPDDPVERERALRARAGVRRVQTPDGLVRYVIDADPESAGFLDAALDARTAPKRVRFQTDGADSPEALGDRRSLPQKRLDALVSIARDALARDDGAVAGTAVTMVVTVPLEALLSGLGTAHIDGIDEPISAGAARRLAADAEIIPVVLGTDSQPLDLGRSARLFSPAQRRAIALRDGGCAFPDCTAPPGWCEIAHVLAWLLFGPTDIANGVMLCLFHHRLFDGEGWSLEWRGSVPWFIPPAHVDASRTPRRGGRLRMEAA